jgi:hypothetical protein
MHCPLKVKVQPPRLAGAFELKILAEIVRDLLTGLLRVINDDLGGFLYVFRNVIARIFRGVLG